MTDEVYTVHQQRVRVFMDFWNLQLALNSASGDSRFKIDWSVLPRWLATDGVRLALKDPTLQPQFEGANIYLSYNPKSDADLKLKNWARTFLDRLPGVQVVLKERVPRFAPKCQSCHAPVVECPHCGAKMAGTVEKGVDNAITTDLIKLAWEQAYDWAVLVSSDSDFIPVAEFLQSKGRKVIHAAFPPVGADLSCKCWASFDVGRHVAAFERR